MKHKKEIKEDINKLTKKNENEADSENSDKIGELSQIGRAHV